MKTLIISGFACKASAWTNLFPSPDTTHLSFAKQIQGAQKGDLRKMARVAGQAIIDTKPELIVFHDFGLTTGILGLLRAQKKVPSLHPKLIFFNGAMRGFDVFKNTHPFWIQKMGGSQIEEMVGKAGGVFDEEILSMIPQVKAVYRQVIAVSLIEKGKALFGRSTSQRWKFRGPSLVIASPTDQYVSPRCMKYLAEDIEPKAKYIEIPYGHFPYSIDPAHFQEAIDKFLKG